jgi:hypothetical protein
MRPKGWIILISVCLLLVAVVAGAEDYKNWVPALPQAIQGLDRVGKYDGMNMQTNDQKWCMLHQRYGSEGPEEYIDLTLVWGGAAPFMANYQMMSKFEMETEEQVTKSVEVSGYKGVINLEKADQRGTLMLALDKETIVILEAAPTTKADQLFSVAKKLPLDKFVKGK